MEIQWFPGHMAKTRKLIGENLKLVDVVAEIVDARLPQSSRNPLLDDLIRNKPRILILAKADLAEEIYNQSWTAHYRKLGMSALTCDLKGANPKIERKRVTDSLRGQAGDIFAQRQTKGISSKVIRVMITGIPNVGKSTLINLLAGKAKTAAEDRPGVTKGKQWIRLEQDLELLDTPGILWPNLEDRDGAKKLAVPGAIGEHAYHPQEMALWLVDWLRNHRPGRLNARYGVEETGYEREIARLTAIWDEGQINEDLAGQAAEVDGDAAQDRPDRRDVLSLAILEAIGMRRGFLRKGGGVERDKTSIMLLDELRGGRLGRITWDEPPAKGTEANDGD